MTTIRYWTSWHQNSPAPMNAEFKKKEKEKKKVKKKKKIHWRGQQYGKICMKNWTLMVEGPMYYTSWHEAMMELWEKVFCSEEVEKKLLGLSPKRRAGRCLFNQSHFQGNSVNSAQCALCTVWVPFNTWNTCKSLSKNIV